LRSKACLKHLERASAVGLDHSDVVIDHARRRNGRAVEMRRLRLIAGTIDDLPADKSFDRIFSINLIQIIRDKPTFLSSCAKRLSPNGLLATTFQPRGRRPALDTGFTMAGTLTGTMTSIGLINVRTQALEMNPAPAICILARKG
jgi:ubiquinone/menaquinone biosynthesis C-methylase UbiE